MNKRCIFTVITKSYDNLQEPSVITKEYDYICITDNQTIVSKIWEVRPISEEHMKISCPKRRANAVVMNYHDYLSEDYEICIYVDGNVKIKKDMNDFLMVFGFDLEKHDLMLPNHPVRKCIYQEGTAVIQLKKDDPGAVNQQMQMLREERYPTNMGLYETHLIVFNRRSQRLKEFLAKLFSTYMAMPSKRDQLVFNFVLWKYGTKLKLRVLSHKAKPGSRGKDVRPYNQYAEVMGHNTDQKKNNLKTETKKEILIFENTPYRTDKNLIKAYNDFMELLPEDGWALFRDPDTLFLNSFYGEVFERAIRNNPTAGCFTCLTNRIGNRIQLHSEYAGDDIAKHRIIANKIKNQNYNKYEDFEFKPEQGEALSGMLILLSKKAWKTIGGFKKFSLPSHAKTSKNFNILGVDNQLHKDLHSKKIPLKIIKEMYIYHWYRGGTENKSHLDLHTKYTFTPEKTKTVKTVNEVKIKGYAKKFLDKRKSR